MDRTMYMKYCMYCLKNKVRRRCNIIVNRFTDEEEFFKCRKYRGHRFMELNETNDRIAAYICSGNPFMVARYGGTEMRMLLAYFSREVFHREIDNKGYKESVQLLSELSGFFPNSEKLGEKFVQYMLRISELIDLLGIWGWYWEDFLCEQYAKNAEYTVLRNLEPYYVEEGQPWSYALKGKKVLVIHPFAESIQKQYERRQEIWGKRLVLPEFELQTIKAVQTLADQEDSRFHDWFEALDYMVEECKRKDFDIALIGCGAYGMPLAAEIKRMGKGAIHLGGALQLLFGIRGNRWDKHPVISGFYNDAWIRPLEQMPKGGDKVEGACYW